MFSSVYLSFFSSCPATRPIGSPVHTSFFPARKSLPMGALKFVFWAILETLANMVSRPIDYGSESRLEFSAGSRSQSPNILSLDCIPAYPGAGASISSYSNIFSPSRTS